MAEYMRQPGVSTFSLKTDRLEVELAWPGSAIQKGYRFDVTGHVVQVTLDGAHTFCAPEDFDEGRGSGGLGLCNEFWDYTGALYNSAETGEQFPKLGVGLLTRRREGECNLMLPHQKESYQVDSTADGSSVTFTIRPIDCHGYAARIIKTLSVESQSLFVDYHFQNVGTRPIDLLEYNHNFVCIDDHPIGPEYRLRLPYPVEIHEMPGILTVQGNEIGWNGVPDEAFYCRPRVNSAQQLHTWELLHVPTGVGMREIDDFEVDRFALWGKHYVVSPEVFLRLDLKPGEALRWRRRYEFFRA